MNNEWNGAPCTALCDEQKRGRKSTVSGGDLGAVVKLKTLTKRHTEQRIPGFPPLIPESVFHGRCPRSKGMKTSSDRAALVASGRSDVAFRVDPELHQTIVSGQGSASDMMVKRLTAVRRGE
jgi:hypothetical protein